MKKDPFLQIEEVGDLRSIRVLKQFTKLDGSGELNEAIYGILHSVFIDGDLSVLDACYAVDGEQIEALREKAPKFFDNGLIQEVEIIEVAPPEPEPQPEPGYIHLGLTDCETLPELAAKVEEALVQQASEIAEVKKSVTAGLQASQTTQDSLLSLQRTTATELQALEAQLQSLRRASQQN